MNEEKIKKLIDHLKRIDERAFDMEHWLIPVSKVYSAESSFYTINYVDAMAKTRREDLPEDEWCGTAGCLAGHTCMLFYEEAKELARVFGHIPVVAADILELEPNVSNYLFTPRNVDDLKSLTLPQAIVVLEHFLATGEVDWTLGTGE